MLEEEWRNLHLLALLEDRHGFCAVFGPKRLGPEPDRPASAAVARLAAVAQLDVQQAGYGSLAGPVFDSTQLVLLAPPATVS